jgi:hypothetical protein
VVTLSLDYGCLGQKPKGMTYEEKKSCVSIWRAMDNVFGALGYFFKLNENGWVK